MTWGYIVAWRDAKGEQHFNLFKTRLKAVATFEDLSTRYISVYMARLTHELVRDGVLMWADETRHERKRLGITIGQCAELLGCDAAHYSALERGLMPPTDSEKSQLAWYFKRYAEVAAADKRVKNRS